VTATELFALGAGSAAATFMIGMRLERWISRRAAERFFGHKDIAEQCSGCGGSGKCTRCKGVGWRR